MGRIKAIIVKEFFHIQRQRTAARIELELQDIVKCALGSLDLGAENGLPSDVHGDEEIGIGQCSSQAVQPSHGLVGTGEKPQHGVVDPNGGIRRECGWDEGSIACWLSDVMPGPCAERGHGTLLFQGN